MSEQPPTTATSSELKRRVRFGAGVTAAAQLLGQLVQVGILWLLYRLLTPADFGLFWMVVPFLLLLRNFSTLGLNIGAVQQQQLDGEQLSTLFWCTAAAGLAVSLVTAALAPALAWFYQSQVVFLVTLVMSLHALVVALGAQHQALLERELRLASLAGARIAAQLVGGAAAILAALNGAGVWSLVLGWYFEAALLTAFCWWLAAWRPTAQVSLSAARGLLRFGGYYTAASLFFALAQNLDKILVGWWLGPVAAGYYSQAFNWMMKPVYLVTTPLASALLPALARAAHDRALYSEVLIAFTRLVGMILIPAGIGLAITSPEVMLVLGGPQWAPAGDLLRWLALAIVVQGFINSAGSIWSSVGKSDRLLIASMVMTVALAMAYGLGLFVGNYFHQPLTGLAASYAAAMWILFGPYMAACLHSAGVDVRAWFQSLWPILLSAAAMGAVVMALRTALVHIAALPPAANLAIEVPAGVAVFALCAWRQVTWAIGQLRRVGN